MRQLTPAEQLLQYLGVTKPAEIDLEAIAHHVNVTIRHGPLDGCEARIIGNADKAIITVNQRSHFRRNRFSIAHELGHWHYHRGQCLVCRLKENRTYQGSSPERVADCYAADLLMPRYLFGPMASDFVRLSFNDILILAQTFNTSKTATAFRLVEGDYLPAMLICHGLAGRKWFVRAPSVPSSWFPQKRLDAKSSAFDIQFCRAPESPMPQKICADAWFDRLDAGRFEIWEQTIRAGPGTTLTLLVFTDDTMLELAGIGSRRHWNDLAAFRKAS